MIHIVTIASAPAHNNISTILRYWFDWWIFIFRRVYSVIFFACSILTFFFIFLLFYWCVWLFAMENWVWLERKRAKMRERNKRVVSPREPKAERARERETVRACALTDLCMCTAGARERQTHCCQNDVCAFLTDGMSVLQAACWVARCVRRRWLLFFFEFVFGFIWSWLYGERDFWNIIRIVGNVPVAGYYL